MSAQTPIISSTQDHLDIEDIDQDLVLLKDGSVACVITTTALNFGLLSESEQDATIYAYGALLNSLTFPIQLVIHSKRKDITAYLTLLDEAYEKQQAPLLKNLMKKYREFIQDTVKEQNVLDKKFYVVIPFSSLELGIKSAFSQSPMLIPGKKKNVNLPFSKEYILPRAQTALEPKKVHLIRLLARLGLKARQLTTQELIQLFFEIYNPEATGISLASSHEYQSPLVQTSPALHVAENPPQFNPVTPSSPPLATGNSSINSLPTTQPTLTTSTGQPLPNNSSTQQSNN